MTKKIIIGFNLDIDSSTGTIMMNALSYAKFHSDFDYHVFVRFKNKNITNASIINLKNSFGAKIYRKILAKKSYNVQGMADIPTTISTIHAIKKIIKNYDEVVIHLHNVSSIYLNLYKLFYFFKSEKKIKKVFYTFHGVWPFTGNCYAYNLENCRKWQCGCYNCSLNNTSKLDQSKILDFKKHSFELIKDKLTIFTVSSWLEDEVKNSFLSEYRIIKIYGETSITPVKKDYDLINKLELNNNSKIVLTVSNYWNDLKGTKYIYQIAKNLPSNYKILVIGGNFDTQNSTNIIHINHVENNYLSHYYSIANCYLSTSQFESLGLTTCEAQICGIPVVAFGHTAIKETIQDNITGFITGPNNNINLTVKKIVEACEKQFDVSKIKKNGSKFKSFKNSKIYLLHYNS